MVWNKLNMMRGKMGFGDRPLTWHVLKRMKSKVKLAEGKKWDHLMTWKGKGLSFMEIKKIKDDLLVQASQIDVKGKTHTQIVFMRSSIRYFFII